MPTIPRKTGAFTLIEVLIAAAIFSVVLIAINMVFFSALKLRNSATQAVEKTAPARQALEIIQRDLANIVIPGGTIFGEFQTGTQNGMTATATMNPGQQGPAFYTTSGVINDLTPFGEVQRISYGLVDATNGADGKDLVRYVSRNVLATAQETPVMQRLASGFSLMAFLFFDGRQWRDSWDSTTETTKLPAAVKVRLALWHENESRMAAPIEIVVPIQAQPSTNQTSGGTS